jgi:hypothetical protein
MQFKLLRLRCEASNCTAKLDLVVVELELDWTGLDEGEKM